MLKNFTYSFPTQLIFGSNSIDQLSSLVKKNNISRALLVYGSGSVFSNGSHQDVMSQLNKAQVQVFEHSHCPTNPDIDFVSKGIEMVVSKKIGLVLAIGGGSVIDASKAIALFSQNLDTENIWEHMISKEKIKKKALPIGVVLTSFGTGSEGNGSFVISNYQTKEKLGQSDLSVRPMFAICDPHYAATLSKEQVALGCTDTVSHLLEQYFCLEEDNFLNDIIVSLMQNVVKNSLSAYKDKNDLTAKSELMLASTFSLSYFLSLGKTLDWSAHKIEHALSGAYQVPHAAGLACIFPAWMELASTEKAVRNKLILLGLKMRLINQDDAGQEKKVIAYFKQFFTQLGLTTSLKDLLGDEPEIKKIADIALKYGEFGNVFHIDRKKCEKIIALATK